MIACRAQDHAKIFYNKKCNFLYLILQNSGNRGKFSATARSKLRAAQSVLRDDVLALTTAPKSLRTPFQF